MTPLTDTERRMVEDNMGLVGWTINRHFRNYTPDEAADAMQDGTLGLMRAVKDYDPDRAAFSTYAINWIRAYIQRGTGRRRGKNYRYAVATKAYRYVAPSSLDQIISDDATLGDLVAGVDADPAEEVCDAVLVDSVEVALRAACSDRVDEMLVDGMMAHARRDDRFAASAVTVRAGRSPNLGAARRRRLAVLARSAVHS